MMEDYYQDSFRGFAEDDMFYEGTFEDFVTVPEGFTVTIPTTGRAVIDEAVDAIVPADFTVNYPARGVTKKAEADAQNNGRFVKHSLNYIRSQSSDIDPIRDFARNLFRSGKACFKVVPDYTLWPVLPESEEEELKAKGAAALKKRIADIKAVREENFPLTVRSLHPSCIMEDPTISARKLWIVERYTMSNAEVRGLYSQQVEEFQNHDFWSSSFYQVHELWTATYVSHTGKLVKGKHWVFINYEAVVEEDSPYDNLPYVLKYSGHGREAYEGQPQYKSVGFMTRQVKSNLLAESRRATHFDAIMSQLAFPIAFMDERAEDANISFEPGAVNFVPADLMQNIQNTFVSARIPDAEYLSSLGWIGGQIERGTVSRTARGASMPGADSAAQYSLQSNNGKLRLESCKQATEQAVAQVGSMFLEYVDKHLRAPVSVFVAEDTVAKYTVSPDTIRGHYRLAVTFQPNEDAIKERKLILANDAINKGGLSPFDAYVFAGFENPVELIARRLVYDILMSDQVKNYFAMEQLKEWGVDARQVALEGQMQDQQDQFQLREFANAMQLGTGAGTTGPQTEQGQPMPGVQQPMPQQGPTGPMGGQGGAPQQVMPPEVSGMMQDLNALGGGVQP